MELPKIDHPLAPDPPPEIPGELAMAVRDVIPDFNPSALTPQEEKFVHYVVSGMPLTAAAIAVGAPGYRGNDWVKRPAVIAAIGVFRAKNREKLEFTVETAHQMYIEALEVAKHASDATAMKNCIDSLVKLHGIAAAPKPTKVELTVNNKRQAERMTDEQLLAEAGLDRSYLSPVPKQRKLPDPVVEGEFTEVKQDA